VNELIVLLPAYNEEENLEILVESWQKYWEELFSTYQLHLHIIVVNDGSQDATKQVGEQLEERYDNLTLVSHKVNQGLGKALKTGIQYILKNHSDAQFTCIMDCDNTQQPNYVLDMIEKQRESQADIIIASRYAKGASVKGLKVQRVFISLAARAVFTISLTVGHVRDYTCGYRLYCNELLEQAQLRFGEKLIEENGFTCMVELLYKLYTCGGRFAEVPFELRYDWKRGESKMKIMKTAINSFRLIRRLKKIPKEGRKIPRLKN